MTQDVSIAELLERVERLEALVGDLERRLLRYELAEKQNQLNSIANWQFAYAGTAGMAEEFEEKPKRFQGMEVVDE
jgi:hypothetical protein